MHHLDVEGMLQPAVHRDASYRERNASRPSGTSQARLNNRRDIEGALTLLQNQKAGFSVC